MGVNKYFNAGPQNVNSEQLLIDDLITEAIRINGINCYYILRDSLTSMDYILGEDPTSLFSRAYLMEMYLDNPGGSVSGGDLLTKFGLQITDASNFVIAHRTFERYVPNQFRAHPYEGDLIYVPTMNQTFEIKKVEEEQNFYTLGKKDPYFYNLRSQTFQFSQEEFNTGIEEVDNVQSDSAMLISFPVANNTGNFIRGETVYQGASVTLADATAKVDEWFPTNNTIHVYYTWGEFENNVAIHGAQSGVSGILGYYDDRNNVSRYDDNSNNYFVQEANNIIDLSVNNPAFGNPGPQNIQ